MNNFLCPLYLNFGIPSVLPSNWTYSLDYFIYFHDINYQLVMGYQYVSSCPKLNSLTITTIHVVVKVRKLEVILDSSPSHPTHTYLVT